MSRTEAERTLEALLEWHPLWDVESPKSKVIELDMPSWDGHEITLKRLIQKLKDGTDTSVCANPAKHLIAGDFDSAQGITEAREAATLLGEIGIECLVVESGRPGHAHLWGYTDPSTPSQREEGREILRRYKVDRSNSAMRLPGTLNRNRQRSKIIYGNCIEFQRKLRAAPVTYKKATGDDLTESAHAYKQLSQFVWSRSGLSLIEHTIKTDPKIQGKPWFDRRRRLRSDLIRELSKILTESQHTFAKHQSKATTSRSDITRWMNHALHMLSGSKHGLRNTVLAIARIASRTPDPEFYLPIRTLSEEAGIDKTTADRHIKQLENKGLLTKAKRSEGTLAATFTLTGNPHFCNTIENSPGVCTVLWCKSADFATSLERSNEFKDAFTGRSSVKEVYVAIAERGLKTTKEIRELTGRSADSVERAIRQLTAWNLIVREGHAFRPVEQPDFGSVAKLRGKSGANAARKVRHSNEREGYADALSREQRDKELKARSAPQHQELESDMSETPTEVVECEESMGQALRWLRRRVEERLNTRPASRLAIAAS